MSKENSKGRPNFNIGLSPEAIAVKDELLNHLNKIAQENQFPVADALAAAYVEFAYDAGYTLHTAMQEFQNSVDEIVKAITFDMLEAVFASITPASTTGSVN